VEGGENFRIFQETKEPLTFKAFALYPKIKPLELLQLLIDLDKRSAWDDKIESNQNISDIPSGHLAIIHRVHKPNEHVNFGRESYLSRVIFNTVGKFFVLEKSLDDIEEIQKSTTVLNRIVINHNALKIGALPNGGSALSILYSQQVSADVSAEVDAKIIIESFKKLAKLHELDLEKVLPATAREEFDVFLNHWKPKSNDDEEESKYEDGEKFLDEGDLVKDDKKGDSKEFSEVFAGLNNGTVVKNCVDPKFPYPDASKYKDNKYVEKQGHWLLGTDFKRSPDCALEVLNQEWIDSQKRVLGQILKNMGKNLLEGKSIMNMSLPVSIFSKDSILQRAAKIITYAPDFVERAATTTDELEQFKIIVAFYFSMLHIGIEQQKPFNPILGETYQGFIAGVPVLLEQVSHHPPISYIHYRAEKYFIYGTYNLEANAGANSITGLQKGRMNVALNNGNEFTATFPQANVCNMIMGKRSFYWSKKMRIYDRKNGFYCEIQVYPDEKGLIGGFFSRKKDVDCAAVKGKIWKIKKEYTAHLWDKNAKKEIAFNEKEHVQDTLGTISGTWLDYLEIDNKRYWSLNEHRPYELVDQRVKVLPSDSLARQDLICRMYGENALSQEWKEKLEVLQRNDRKLRAEKAKKKK